MNPTPKGVFDDYHRLDNADQQVFLKLFGRSLTAESLILLVGELPLPERERFSDRICARMVSEFFPLVCREAQRLARERPDLCGNDFDEEVGRRVGAFMVQAYDDLAELVHKKRNRKPADSNVLRYVEICDRRKADPKKWSLKELKKTYGISIRRILRILEKEPEWRRLLLERE
jgi:hypothetical protein